ncbi:MAG: LysR substrate-binding domain-containing protein, partial [Bacilli bacterium]
GTRAHMEHVMHAIGITPRAFIPIASNLALVETLKRGTGISIVSKRLVKGASESGDLREITLTDAPLTRQFHYCFSNTFSNTILREITIQAIQHVREQQM